MDTAIELRGISKRFGQVQANRDIDLSIRTGRVLALLGENGAGKSTLMSILAGQTQPDKGAILVNDQPLTFQSTQHAIKAGIGMVYQHFKLVEAMTVAENVLLGKPGSFWLRAKGIEEDVGELAATFGMTVRPEALVADLSMGEKQQVEILKLLYRRSSVLIFDEPTAVLTPGEAKRLFVTMRSMAGQGKAIVFISHKLEEVMSVADEIAILRQGEIVDTMEASSVQSTTELAGRMVGREVLLEVNKEMIDPRQIVLKVEALAGNGLKDLHLELRQGEILGVVGVAGNGQKPLVETLCGLTAPVQGTVRILGDPWHHFFARRRWQSALSYIPEDRQGLATCQGLDLLDNFLLTTSKGFCWGPWLQKRAAREKAGWLIEEFDVRPQNLDTLAWQLSGGNLQKLVLAREFYRKPRLIVAEQPTQGLDIAAAEEVWNLLLKAREQAGILLVTGDLSEALALSDRLIVMFDGRICAAFAATNEEEVARIPEYMAGLEPSFP
ncbi:MAG: branched-chain amino acid ABC transporter ATP-binding protein [Desulfobulbus propionicus]|nr:MAG: branched-chain amino acid ABC transporter ATP-binding protein [Desulfobulbus propionicus]